MVARKKLDQWADLLLDTGKRNNLINFRDTKASTAEVLLPSPDVLFEKIDGSASFEVFDPKIVDDADDNSNVPSLEENSTLNEEDLSDKKSAYVAQYTDKLKRQNQILLYNAAVNPLTAIKNIDKKSREFIEETGVKVAYMAFGFIHWKENDASNYIFRAPVLLVPIQLEQASAVEPYFIKSAEDDIIVNPTFAYKLDADYGVKLPDYSDEGLHAYLEKVKRLVARLQWTVTSECKIGIFSFLKINMYRDLKDNAAEILANQNVRRLLGEPVDSEAALSTDGECKSVSDPLIELHSVVDADSSQIEAIEMAKSGKSFVLQGPPGTGKSQTITNVIAECLSDGKKVLFVSEKLAALNVVYDKLKKSGLSEFCLQLHSHKANKKDVISDICHTLRTPRSAVSSKADAEIALKEKAKKQLDAYAIELHKQRPVIEKSLYQLYESYSAFRLMPDIDFPIYQLSTKGEEYLTKASSLLEQYVDYIPSIGYDYKKNSWYGYRNQDTSYQTKNAVKSNLVSVSQFLQQLVPLLQEIAKKYDICCTSIADATNWRAFFSAAAVSDAITPALLNREQFYSMKSVLNDLKDRSVEILSIRSSLDADFEEDVYKLDGDTYCKKLKKQFNGVFSRLFNAEYKQIITDLRLSKKDGKKPSYDEAVRIAEQLSAYQLKGKDYAAIEAPAKASLGTAYKGIETVWEDVLKDVSILDNLFSHGVSFGKLADCSDFRAEQSIFLQYSEQLDAAFSVCSEETLCRLADSFDKTVFDVKNDAACAVSERLGNCQKDMDKLDNWCHFRNLLSELAENQILTYIDTGIKQNIPAVQFVGAFKKLFYFQWVDTILSETPVLSTFNRISQDKAIQSFSEKDIEQFEINKVKIRAELSSNRPSLDMIAPGSALSTLLREGEKKGDKRVSVRCWPIRVSSFSESSPVF